MLEARSCDINQVKADRRVNGNPIGIFTPEARPLRFIPYTLPANGSSDVWKRRVEMEPLSPTSVRGRGEGAVQRW